MAKWAPPRLGKPQWAELGSIVGYLLTRIAGIFHNDSLGGDEDSHRSSESLHVNEPSSSLMQQRYSYRPNPSFEIY